MKIQIMSDLHMEFGSKFAYEDRKDTTLILAGDIDSDLAALKIFIGHLSNSFKDILMVTGNHEYYGNSIESVHECLNDLDKEITNFHFLENEIFQSEDVTFIGACLWSSPEWGVFNQINDHYQIEFEGHRLNSDDITHFNKISSDYIKHQLLEIPGKKIVITHFGPDEALMHAHWREYKELNSYFWARGFENYFHKADMWFYGHTHDSGDQVLDGCRCICNPYGYYGYNYNWLFESEMILEI